MKGKKLSEKMKQTVQSIWGRKELCMDALGILMLTTIITIIPILYRQITSVKGRVAMVFISGVLFLVVGVGIMIRIVRRNKENKLRKSQYIHILLRCLPAVMGIWIFSYLLLKWIHPSLMGIYAIELSQKDKWLILLLNSFFFSLYSQMIIAVFTGAEENWSVFMKRLGKTLRMTALPMFGMTVLFMVFLEWIKNADKRMANLFNILLTACLWITAIALNEWIKERK